MRRLFFLLVVLLLLAGAGAVGYALLIPYAGFRKPVFVDIGHGTTTTEMADQLQSAGVVQSRWLFLLMRVVHPQARLQAGEYRFTHPATAAAVFDTIHRGDIYFEEITVPEGDNLFDIAALLKKTSMVDAAAFLKTAASPDLVKDLDPQAPSLEGFLFPSTYRMTRKTTASDLCRAMVTEFRRQWGQLGGFARAADVHRVVTLASLVEKETGLPAERPLVAAVFANRLQRGMPLQCDPTAIYAAMLENRFRGTIYRSDLQSQNAYNTYAHVGIPPGPIANPGVSALKAALEPAPVDYLYFVAKADGSGGHQFSAELTEHLRAVEAYRRGSSVSR